MNIVLWILQVLLAAHAVMGAVWKFSHSEQMVPSLSAIPHVVWRGLSVMEIVCALALIIPALGLVIGAMAPLAILAPIAAACFAAEMLLFCVVHLASGATRHGQMIYWLVVGVLCGLVAYGRFVLAPL